MAVKEKKDPGINTKTVEIINMYLNDLNNLNNSITDTKYKIPPGIIKNNISIFR